LKQNNSKSVDRTDKDGFTLVDSKKKKTKSQSNTGVINHESRIDTLLIECANNNNIVASSTLTSNFASRFKVIAMACEPFNDSPYVVSR
jgi:hypothetical protein